MAFVGDILPSIKIKFHTNEKEFAVAFLEAYLAPGFGNLPQREMDLLILKLLVDHDRNLSWDAPPSAFKLAQMLGVKRSRVRSMMDELSFRRPAKERDELARKNLRSLLLAQDLDDTNGSLKLQVEDGYCREYAKNLVTKAGGVVDGSFDRTIITLTAEKFLILSAEVATDKEQVRLARILKNKTDLAQSNCSDNVAWHQEIRHEFLKGVARQAGKELASDIFRLGRLLLTGGTSELGSAVLKVYRTVARTDQEG